MESLFILVPLTFLVIVTVGAFFWWSAKSGQFDDLDREAKSVLEDKD